MPKRVVACLFPLALVLGMQAGAGADDPPRSVLEFKLLVAEPSASVDLQIDGSRIRALVRDPQVRSWLRQQIQDLVRFNGEDSLYYPFLFAGGVGPEDIDFFAGLYESRRGSGGGRRRSFLLSTYMRSLLALAPYALNELIDERLLQAVGNEAARDLVGAPVQSLWLATSRLSPERLAYVLENAWTNSYPENLRRLASKGISLAEFEVRAPVGDDLGDVFFVKTRSGENDSRALLWPDGKVRFATRSEPGRPLKFEMRIDGFHETQPLSLDLVPGETFFESVDLSGSFATVTGVVNPAPRAPLFVTLSRGTPQGRGVHDEDSYESESSNIAIVDSEGKFKLAYARPRKKLGEADRLIFFSVNRDIVHEEINPQLERRENRDLGEIRLARKRSHVSVPIELTWPSGVPLGDEVSAAISWKPRGAKEAVGTTPLSVKGFSLRGLLGGKSVRVGIARNVSPGKYIVSIKFDRMPKQGAVEDFEANFTVQRRRARPLKLKPDPANEDKPGEVDNLEDFLILDTGSGRRDDYRLRVSPEGTPYLLWSVDGGLCMRKYPGGEAGPVQRILSPFAAGEDTMIGLYALDFHFGPDGNIYLFALRGEDVNFRRLDFRILSPEGHWLTEWNPIRSAKGERLMSRLPVVLPYAKGFDIFFPTLRPRQLRLGLGKGLSDYRDIDTEELWTIGRLTKTRYKKLQATPPKENSLRRAMGVAQMVAGSLKNPGILYVQRRKLNWATFPAQEISTARDFGEDNPLSSTLNAHARSNGDAFAAVYLFGPATTSSSDGSDASANPQDARKARYSLWAGKGRPGSPLKEILRVKHYDALGGTTFAETPGGQVYLFSVVRERKEVEVKRKASEKKDADGAKKDAGPIKTSVETERSVITYWNLSADEPEQFLTEIRAKEPGSLRVAFASQTTAYIAFRDDGRLRVAKLELGGDIDEGHPRRLPRETA